MPTSKGKEGDTCTIFGAFCVHILVRAAAGRLENLVLRKAICISHLVQCFSKGPVYPASDCLHSTVSHEGGTLTHSKLSKRLTLSPSFLPVLGDRCLVPTAMQRGDCACLRPDVELTVFGLSLPLLFPNSMLSQCGFATPGLLCYFAVSSEQCKGWKQTKSVWEFHFLLQCQKGCI